MSGFCQAVTFSLFVIFYVIISYPKKNKSILYGFLCTFVVYAFIYAYMHICILLKNICLYTVFLLTTGFKGCILPA